MQVLYHGVRPAADLAPTIAEAAGLPVPAGMQGRSWWPQLAGGEPIAAQREDVYSEYYNSSIFVPRPPGYENDTYFDQEIND